MNCNEAIEIMLDSTSTDREAALNYILSHPECRARLDQFARAISSQVEFETPCAQIRAQMADYYIEEERTADASQRYPDVAAHLERCPYCQVEYADLQQTMRLLNTGALSAETHPLPSPPPSFDLSFIKRPLPHRIQSETIWRTQQAVRTLLDEIRVVVSQGSASIETLTAELQPRILAVALRSSERDRQSSSITIPDPDAAIDFQIEIKPMQDEKALVTLTILELGTNTPVVDARVTLQTSTGRRVTQSMTGDEGTIEFPGVAPDQYIILVQNMDQRWELPLTVSNE